VLFAGIAVDFAIQFSVRYREARHDLNDSAAAIRQTARRAGGAILVAALATAAGFLAFVPTAFSGVAELGLIAGVGMLIAFLCTLTFLPAAITVCRPSGEKAEIGFAWGTKADGLIIRSRRAIPAGFVALAVLARPGPAVRLRPAGHTESRYRSDAYAAGPDEFAIYQSVKHRHSDRERRPGAGACIASERTARRIERPHNR
jgi:uncharacterized membrane protein YdfJ with MMPL/SSD domain